MKFYAAIMPDSATVNYPDALVEIASLGYDGIWIPDQEFLADPFVLWTNALRSVDIDVGVALTSPFTRHPVQIARSIATVGHLSGRDDLVCGLGLGNPVRVLKPLGVRPAGAPRQLAAAVEIIKRLLRGEEVTITAAESDFKLHSVQLDIDPLPSARIFIGTRGPRTLEKAGSVADGVFVESLFTPEGIGWARNLLNSGAQAASGGQFDRPYIAWQLVEVLSENPTTMSESARNFAAMLMSTTATTTLRTLGIGDATIAMVKMPSFSPRDVPEVDLRKFVASGDPDDLSSRVAAAEAAGASGWCSVFVGAQDRAVSMAKRFAQVIESYN